MELLEFRGKIFDLLGASKTEEIGDLLYNAVIGANKYIFDGYKLITSGEEKDWLQALWQYYEADRTEKKQDYTPKSLCKLVAALAGDCKSIYDCCGGSGALTLETMKTVGIENVFVEELDERVIPFLLFNLCLHNANGYVVNGDSLSRERYKCYKLSKGKEYSSCDVVECDDTPVADVAISNPPYNISWNVPSPIEAMVDGRFPVLPPKSSANYAFVFNCLSRSKEKAVLILPNGVMTESTEYDCRKYLVDNDLIETIICMPEKMFEITNISTCIFVLNKCKKHKGEICFIDSRKNCVSEERYQNGQFGGASHTSRTYKKLYNVLSEENIYKILGAINERENNAEFSAVKKNEEVAKNDYVLTPSRYIDFCEKEQPHRSFQEIADNINYISRMQNSCKLIINETIAKTLGLDMERFKQGKKNSEELARKMKALGVDVAVDDYIQFSKNKNEFVLKCNDKELLPDIFLQFFSVWKNQIALLNTMQNRYLEELRDAMIPDLMSGKIEL